MGWTALLCLALSAFAQESEIEIEEPPDPADAPEEKPPEEKPPEEKPPEARAPQEAFGPAPARGEGHELKWTEVRDRAKTFTLEVPDDWRLREAPPEKGREGKTFDLLLPGREGMCSLRIYDEADRTDPRGAPARIREAFAKDAGYVSSEIRGDPVPHALLRFRDPKGEWENLVAFIRTRGRTMQLRLGGRPDDVAFARADALAAAQRLTTAMPELPEIPEGFKV